MHFRYCRDQEYLVRDGKVEIVDSNTGRVKEGSRWNASLHQARLARTASWLRQQPASCWKRRSRLWGLGF